MAFIFIFYRVSNYSTCYQVRRELLKQNSINALAKRRLKGFIQRTHSTKRQHLPLQVQSPHPQMIADLGCLWI